MGPKQMVHHTRMPIRARPKHRRTCGEEQLEPAQDLAVAAFGFLAADSRRLQRFLEVSGIELAALREAAREPDFLAGVLDHLCGEEELLVGFARESGIEPNRVLAARHALHGYGWEHDTP